MTFYKRIHIPTKSQEHANLVDDILDKVWRFTTNDYTTVQFADDYSHISFFTLSNLVKVREDFDKVGVEFECDEALYQLIQIYHPPEVAADAPSEIHRLDSINEAATLKRLEGEPGTYDEDNDCQQYFVRERDVNTFKQILDDHAVNYGLV